jgi:hypothetical protein
MGLKEGTTLPSFPILSDLISIQISALVRSYSWGCGDVPKKVRVFGSKKLFLKRCTVRSTTRTLTTDKNDHSAFTAILRFKAVLRLKNYLTTFYVTIVYYILGYNQLSNSCCMAADEPVHVRSCSTASTPACTVPDLLSLFEKYQKVLTGRRAPKPPRNRRC